MTVLKVRVLDEQLADLSDPTGLPWYTGWLLLSAKSSETRNVGMLSVGSLRPVSILIMTF
jgi:hypothetical protein